MLFFLKFNKSEAECLGGITAQSIINSSNTKSFIARPLNIYMLSSGVHRVRYSCDTVARADCGGSRQSSCFQLWRVPGCISPLCSTERTRQIYLRRKPRQSARVSSSSQTGSQVPTPIKPRLFHNVNNSPQVRMCHSAKCLLASFILKV